MLLFDTITLSALNVIQAHKTPIACLALNSTGTMLATASDKGTVVRVFSVPDAKKLWQFRRGSSSARIWSINFNLSSTLLSVSSDSSTIHIYKLAMPGRAGTGGQAGGAESSLASQLPSTPGGPGEETPSEASATSPPPNFLAAQNAGSAATSSLKRRSYHIGKSFVGGVGGYLPRSVSEMWEPQRDFAHIKLKGSANLARTVVAMSSYVSSLLAISPQSSWSNLPIGCGYAR